MSDRPAPTHKEAGGSARGASLADKLARVGVLRDEDLVLHLPLRYEDHTRLVPLARVRAGATVQTEGVVANAEIQYRPRRQLVCLLRDAERRDATLTLRFFSFYPSHQKALTQGARIRVYGDVRDGYFGPEIVHPQFRVIHEDTPLPDRLTPVYPSTAGLSQDVLRKAVERALAADAARTAEVLPEDLLRRRDLWSFADALRFLHAPPPRLSAGAQKALDERTHPAWTRIKFDELLAQQLSLKAHRKARASRRAPVLTGTGALTRALLERIPFKLTRAQQRVWHEISHDLRRGVPMQRLLQGDVGSGKTIVAALAALQAIESGKQVAFMAPTEILAEQHYRKLQSWLSGVGVEIAWLSGSLPAKARRKAAEALESGAAHFAIGTHALFQEGVALPRLGLAIIDEQHRFGVAQRLALRDKGMTEAHQLMMSATPIPRTLAMTFYADLDVSMLDEMPPGRTPVATRLVSQRRRAEIIAWVGKACREGRQAYWVCPLIEESEKLELQTAVALHAELTRAFAAPETQGPVSGATAAPATSSPGTLAAVPAARPIVVGLVHGRMKPDEKAATMEAFARGDIGVLVATTVIEVGVDIPNASIMVIEHAERFGLAQLHQLRGRVGRGAAESSCVLLFEEPLTDTARQRLKVIYETSDGFEIARQDLLIRGPGEFLGARQSGVPLLRFADLERDVALIEQARDAADELLKTDPAAAMRHLDRWLGARQAFIKA
ncbi:MAG: ATP-dependent DNA helicase RecG [Betaproteobacteria bacterium]|nr:ATP-dependent DNA helicase RecG [Betaproteobacteria bacterium]